MKKYGIVILLRKYDLLHLIYDPAMIRVTVKIWSCL